MMTKKDDNDDVFDRCLVAGFYIFVIYLYICIYITFCYFMCRREENIKKKNIPTFYRGKNKKKIAHEQKFYSSHTQHIQSKLIILFATPTPCFANLIPTELSRNAYNSMFYSIKLMSFPFKMCAGVTHKRV